MGFRIVAQKSSWLFTALLLLFTAPVLLQADESSWATFKGSSERLGVFEGKSVDLPFKISWKHTPEGKTNGFVDWGPVAANGIIYTPDGLNNVLALNAQTGEIIWQQKLISNIFSVSLSENRKKLYVTTAITTKPTATLYALDSVTGEALWDNMVDGQPAVGGMEGAPAIKDGKIYVGYLQYEGHGGIAAYDAETGKMIWHAEIPRFSPYTPITVSKDKMFVSLENKKLYAVATSSGRILWEKELADLAYAAPVVWNDKVYLAAARTLYVFDTRTGQIMWQKTLDGEVGHSSVAISNKTIYLGSRDSKVFALNAESGSPVWTKELEKGPIESSVLVDPKKKILYVGTQENWMLVLALKNGGIKHEIRLSDDQRGIWKSSPAIYEGRLYVGSLDKTFYALE